MFVAVAEVQRAGAAEAPRGSKKCTAQRQCWSLCTHFFCEVVRHVLGVEMEYWSSGGLPLARFTVR